MAMPVAVLALFNASQLSRYMRAAMLDNLTQDYVRTARAKGISERAVVINHALRNAWLPVVTMIGLEFGFLLGGVVVIETVFSWPGIGRLVFNAINQRDIPVVQAAVIILSLIFIALNLIVDLIYARIDPRVKL
jgi:peptide/nickel transport system permease protein